MRISWVAIGLAVSVSSTAAAGRTNYGWLYGTEVSPPRTVEVETWISENNGKTDDNNSVSTSWWIGPVVGVTSQLELAVPLELLSLRSDTMPSSFALEKYGVEARYRLVSPDSTDLVPLVRVAIKRVVATRETIQPEADIVASYTSGRFEVLADLGAIGEINGRGSHFEIRPGAGASIRAVGDLRFGAEIYAELALDTNGANSWASVGPNLAWTHGRFWLSAGYGIGIYGVADAPRVKWAIAF